VIFPKLVDPRVLSGQAVVAEVKEKMNLIGNPVREQNERDPFIHEAPVGVSDLPVPLMLFVGLSEMEGNDA